MVVAQLGTTREAEATNSDSSGGGGLAVKEGVLGARSAIQADLQQIVHVLKDLIMQGVVRSDFDVESVLG